MKKNIEYQTWVKCEEPRDGRQASTVPRGGWVKLPPLTRHMTILSKERLKI